MEQLKTSACYAIDDNEKALKELGKKVWTYAEPGGREIKTSAALRKFLKEKEFAVTTFKAMKTSFRAEWGESECGGAKRPNIGLLCRYDANRRYGHIHGNNLVVEVTIGAALGLQQAIRAASTKIGKVTVIGCPNSAQNWLIYLLNWKVLKDIDIFLSAIPGPVTAWNPVYLGTKTFRATYKLGAIENAKGLNKNSIFNSPQPIPVPEALSGTISAVQNVLAVHEHFGSNWKAQGYVTNGGKNPRQTPSFSDATVKITGQNNLDLALLEKRIVPCLEAAATSTRCLFELDVANKSIHSMINNILLGYYLQLNAYHCGMLSTPLKNCNIVLNPIDMGNLSLMFPAIRPMYYIGTDDQVGTLDFKKAVSTELAHRYSIAMAKALAMTALDVMISPKTLYNVKQEHAESIRKAKAVKFEPFAVNKPTEIPLAPLPQLPDTNTGWSRMW